MILPFAAFGLAVIVLSLYGISQRNKIDPQAKENTQDYLPGLEPDVFDKHAAAKLVRG